MAPALFHAVSLVTNYFPITQLNNSAPTDTIKGMIGNPALVRERGKEKQGQFT